MRKLTLVLIVLLVSSLGSPFVSSAFAKDKTDEVTIECKCPDGNHYGHCNDKGKHKGHHKNGDCEHEEMDA
ncbi:MAG: hypothetical protein ACYC6O_01515 [Thermoleophilia bacterium]